MDKKLYEKYADKLLEAMKAEKLMNKEVAEIFSVPASYMSDMRKHPEKVTDPFMEKIRTWAISGKPLKEYKLPAAPDTEAAEINQQQADEARDRAERKFRSKLAVKGLLKQHREETAAAVAQSVDTEIEDTGKNAALLRQEIATAIRKEYEAVQPDTKITVVARKDGKVDVSKLNPRTGQVVAAELEFDDDGTFKVTYRFKS